MVFLLTRPEPSLCEEITQLVRLLLDTTHSLHDNRPITHVNNINRDINHSWRDNSNRRTIHSNETLTEIQCKVAPLDKTQYIIAYYYYYYYKRMSLT